MNVSRAINDVDWCRRDRFETSWGIRDRFNSLLSAHRHLVIGPLMQSRADGLPDDENHAVAVVVARPRESNPESKCPLQRQL